MAIKYNANIDRAKILIIQITICIIKVWQSKTFFLSDLNIFYIKSLEFLKYSKLKFRQKFQNLIRNLLFAFDKTLLKAL